MKKKIIIILLVILVMLLILLRFYNEIGWFIYEKIYDYKYKGIYSVEKNLSYDIDKSLIEENLIEIDDFKVVLSDLNYTENKLNFNLKFSHLKPLNHSGYILRVANKDYYLGDRFNGQISLDSSFEWLISMDKFNINNFENYKENSHTLKRLNAFENNLHNLLNEARLEKQDELLDDGSLVHKISFEIPEKFIIDDTLKIVLFDMNYQNIGNTEFYQVKAPLSEIKYTIDFTTPDTTPNN